MNIIKLAGTIKFFFGLVFVLLLSFNCFSAISVTESQKLNSTIQNEQATTVSPSNDNIDSKFNDKSSDTSILNPVLTELSTRPHSYSDQDDIESSSVETITRLIEYHDQRTYHENSSPPPSPIEASSLPSVSSSAASGSTSNLSKLNLVVTTIGSDMVELEPTASNEKEDSSKAGTTTIIPTPSKGRLDDDILDEPSSSPTGITEIRQVNLTTQTSNSDGFLGGNDNYTRVEILETIADETTIDDDDNGVDDEDAVMREKLHRASRSKEKVEEDNILDNLLAKKPFSKYLSVEQKWDDLFRRFFDAKKVLMRKFTRMFFKDLEQYTDISVSPKCLADLRYAQNYAKNSSNVLWAFRMFDSFGKNEAGLLTGNVPQLGHVLQCVRVRAPDRSSNISMSFKERDFYEQTKYLGERFRGKYCLISVRPVMPPRPKLISRYNNVLDLSLLSNLSYMGQTRAELEHRKLQSKPPPPGGYDEYSLVSNLSVDYVPPFDSPLYQYIIEQNFAVYTYTRQMGVCYPSSCSKEDIRQSIQRTFDDYHQVVSLEYDCEQEPFTISEWLNTSRAVGLFILCTLITVSLVATFLRIYVLVPNRRKSQQQQHINLLNVLCMDKCIGYLYIKVKPATTIVDDSKLENNNRSTSIDALKGFLILLSIYSQLIALGCLPVLFLWSKWTDAMVPYFRSPLTQIFLNAPIWTESFYFISGYIIAYRILHQSISRTYKRLCTSGSNSMYDGDIGGAQMPPLASYVSTRYIQLMPAMLVMMCLNYVWPHLSNGFVMNDQANKLQKPCDKYGWTNMLLFHNHATLNETCLWPTHVSAVQFQLHLLAYPIIYFLAISLTSLHLKNHHSSPSKPSNKQQQQQLHLDRQRGTSQGHYQDPVGDIEGSGSNDGSRSNGGLKMTMAFKTRLTLLIGVAGCLFLIGFGMIYAALVATREQLIVPYNPLDYPDYANYQRVIELMYMPTYNHLTAYFMGILLALLVVYQAHFNDGLVSDASIQNNQWIWSSSLANFNAGIQRKNSKDDFGYRKLSKTILVTIMSFFTIFLVLISTFYWCGLGIEMTSLDNFMFVLLAKFIYLIAFGWLFYSFVATRKNSKDPWIITRFMVPLGRMSGTIYFSSWIIIWFDLLSSPYQWHPSHYFVTEKYMEIISMTLVLSIFSYGWFEGPIKALNYMIRFSKQSNQQRIDNIASLADKVNDEINNSGDYKMNKQNKKNLLRIVGSNVVIDDQQTTQQQQQQQQQTGSYNREVKRLSIVDQRKLQAEMRANTSFASLSSISVGSSVGIVMTTASSGGIGGSNDNPKGINSTATGGNSGANTSESPQSGKSTSTFGTLVHHSLTRKPSAPSED